MIPYFAYGSNMNMERLRERLGREGHQLLGRRRATLHDYRLVFNKRSSFEAGVGYANIEPSGASLVEGTLNDMSEAALALLDRIELVPVHYRRILVQVHDWEKSSPVRAWTYLAQPDMLCPEVLPTRDYIGHLLEARDVLPDQYLGSLAEVECCW
jgi:gamma-glutamylcyclotransferase